MKGWLPVLVVSASVAFAQDATPIFGTTVVIPSGLRGEIYHIGRFTKRLPDFRKRKPVGTIYTSSLDVPTQDFEQGFPGVTKRFEWFAIDYTGRFWIDQPGAYTFSLLSDDGAKLYVDDQLVIDNDGLHPPQEKQGSAQLGGGIHGIRVSYFQGPRFQVALQLKIAGPGQQPRIFSTDEFKPPADPEKWRFPAKPTAEP
ncbi:MAG TPA: PA14 domain-containing protein [Bryobacteraceae bacterium]|nr:PA14 domain-containing protein [Bryobacteraceae bacterium]